VAAGVAGATGDSDELAESSPDNLRDVLRTGGIGDERSEEGIRISFHSKIFNHDIFNIPPPRKRPQEKKNTGANLSLFHLEAPNHARHGSMAFLLSQY
jgi:hypothetical protein